MQPKIKNKLFLFLICNLLILLASCNQGGIDPPINLKLLKYFDEQPELSVSINEILMPNGQTVNEYLKTYDPIFLDFYFTGLIENYHLKYSTPKYNNFSFFSSAYAIPPNCSVSYPQEPNRLYNPQDNPELIIAYMLAWGNFLVTDEYHVHITKCNLDKNKSGIAYRLGAKDYKKLYDKSNSSGQCSELVYALDCSGFVATILNSVGFKINPNFSNANKIRHENFLNKQFKQNTIPLKAKDFKRKLNIDELQSGDIIYWGKNNAYHIGIILKTKDNKIACFHSYGSGQKCKKGDCLQCEKNYQTGRGAKATLITNIHTLDSWGAYWSVVRLTPTNDNKKEYVEEQNITEQDNDKTMDTDKWIGDWTDASLLVKLAPLMKISKINQNELRVILSSETTWGSGVAKIISDNEAVIKNLKISQIADGNEISNTTIHLSWEVGFVNFHDIDRKEIFRYERN